MKKGPAGEDRACQELTNSGFRVVARNVRYRRGEVDIVACRGEDIHFVEVKNWSTYPLDEVGRSINRQKRERILAVSQLFFLDHPEYSGLQPQYDVMFIGPKGIDFLEGALAG